MMVTSYKKHYNNNNTILSVSNPDDFNSSWKIYERKNDDIEKETLKRLRERRIPNPNLSALEVDTINRNARKLTPEERRINKMYGRDVNDSELWKKIVKR